MKKSTRKTNLSDPTLIAPCGINCRLCHAYARDKKTCPGCRVEDPAKAKSCLACKIKNCEALVRGEFEFCFQCDQFPCARIKHLDKRYRTKYANSMIENLKNIQQTGILSFVENENRKWACPVCGAMLCMHKPQCLACGHGWRQT